MSETVLWTNPSPTSNFAAQTITLSDDINNYKYISISYAVSGNYTANAAKVMMSVEDFVNCGNTEISNYPKLAMYGAPTKAIFVRFGGYVSGTSLQFHAAVGTNGQSTNQYLIPQCVYGLK